MHSVLLLRLLACLFFIIIALAQNETRDLTQLLESNENLTQFTTLLTSYGDIYANLSFQSAVTILAPNDEAFNKIPYSSLGPAFEANQSQIVRSILQYHILPGLHPAGGYNGSFSFDKTWLQNTSYTNVTGGQVVGGVQQAGNVNVFTSGLGTRSTLVTPVRSAPGEVLLVFREWTLTRRVQDLPFIGGIVHVIDNFLVPPQNFIRTAPQFNLTAAGGAVANTYVFSCQSPHALLRAARGRPITCSLANTIHLHTALSQIMRIRNKTLPSSFPEMRLSNSLVRPSNRCLPPSYSDF